MKKKLSKLIGLTKEDFDQLVHQKDIKLRRASLIPTTKFGDEIALTSVLLSSFRLVKEFRKYIQTNLKMMKGGQVYTYTEVEFPDFPKCRVDGLIIVVQSGIIKDACLLEMKNGPSVLDPMQIESYLEISKKFSIPRLVTVSNEYVSDPSQTPLNIKVPKDVSLYHLSWSYLLTISHLLLFKNEMNIEDEDQVEIMKEVVNYFESEKSGVCGFSQMKAGWTKTIEKINSGTLVSPEDKDIQEAVLSWQQEEQDLALMLSRELGVLVKSGDSRFKSNYQKRFEHDLNELITTKHLKSRFQIQGAVSDIKMTGLFEKRAIEMSVSLTVPRDKTLRGQVGWINRQLQRCSKKSGDSFNNIIGSIFVDVSIKNSPKSVRLCVTEVETLVEVLKDKEIKSCKVIYLKDFGKMYASRVKFVTTIESMGLDFYRYVVQNLKNWDPSAPQISKIDNYEVSSSEEVIKEVEDSLVVPHLKLAEPSLSIEDCIPDFPHIPQLPDDIAS